MLNLYYLWCFILLMFSMKFLLISISFSLFDLSIMFEWVMMDLNSVSFTYIIFLDWISSGFCFVVLFISSMVILYSSSYMGDYNYSSIRFLFLVLMFVLSMFLMILSPNMVSILLGWDGLGLISYCLVIYYMSLKSYLAGMITCLVNRLGDIGLLISISWMFSYGSWNFMFYLMHFQSYLFYLLMICSFTKSAQIPFSMWLPAAMAAPTPVSALVHSSTLVTAGVYLLMRFFNSNYFINDFLIYVSIVTLVMSSLCANYEFDLKKIIALSTLSQLGLMMSSLFMGMVDMTFFHLLSHAMFKSLLFLCSGIIIHLMGGCQDIRFMGSICYSMPLTSCCLNISNLSLCGFPFLSGFYSKDLIIDSTSFLGSNLFTMILFYLSLGLTSIYSIRLFYYSLMTNFKFFPYLNLSEDIYMMKYSVVILSIFSLKFGCIYMWILNLDMKFLLLPFYLKILTLTMVMLGIFMGYEFSYFYKNLINANNSFYLLNGSMWFMYSFSSLMFKSNFKFGNQMIWCSYWGEFYGGMGISYYLQKFSNLIQIYSMNSFKIFFISMLIWILLLI
uniref:NADH dehydrogenase subunit 5 n=1 Tax=Nephotettix nigropictus TaxID=1563985 RepID=UPI0021D5204A|nr:NADH dehydrogenase subunit 5 [Nephotettix nigropictus]UXD78685.1 NADH dehydrogenase subunit 5 [Nephotettix nigropictus]